MNPIVDLVVTSRRVVRPDGTGPAAVVVRDGVIVAVTAPGEAPVARETIDLGPVALLPGLVDTHVHVNEPGRTEWEGFRTATRAAAAGGITTIVDMPLNATPVTTTVAALDAKRTAAHGQCTVDVGFWAGVVPGNGDDLEPLLDAGALGAKAFLVPSGLEDFPAAGPDDLRAALPRLAARGLPLLVHAEDPDVIARAAPALERGDPRRYATWLASRPDEAEIEAIAGLVRLVRACRARVHVVHLATARAREVIATARADGLPLTVETCPHYLALDATDVADGATAYKCAPPLRDAANRDGLWAMLDEGLIDLVASDHSPCPPELKCGDSGDFVRAWGGIAGLQLGLAVTWTEAARRGHDLDRIATWMAAAPAALAGLAPTKGAIRVGADADLVAFDADRADTVDPDRLEHRHPLTPYTGRRLRGVVRRTWLRGTLVYDDGAFPAPPDGRLLNGRTAAHGDA